MTNCNAIITIFMRNQYIMNLNYTLNGSSVELLALDTLLELIAFYINFINSKELFPHTCNLKMKLNCK